MTKLLEELQHRYQLSQFPYQIECLDISHLQGEWTSGGLTCMIGGLLEKKRYRKYKIQTSKNDDYQSLQEVLIRRFQLKKAKGDWGSRSAISERESEIREQLHLPNLFILDGGKGQLNILNELLQKYPAMKNLFSSVQFAALGK